MRTRILASATTLALAVGLLTASPAMADYAVGVAFPGGNSEFYSPFTGPATVTFTFDGTENDATFEILIRPVGGTKIHSKLVLVDPDTQTSPRAVPFSWPAISVTSARTYVVAVYRNNVLQGSETFLLRPPLAKITSAAPNPFFPWIDDGYKDTTTVRYTLQAEADTEARVFKAKSNGKCCGPKILDDALGTVPAGANNPWVWDGQGEGAYAGNRPKGNYFVKIWADDGVVAPAISKPFKVTIARTYRATDTKQKAGTAYHHTTESTLVRGGDCFVHAQGGYLQVDCHGAKMTVYYRWGLGSAERIEGASFVIDNANNECGPSRRNPGHTNHESFLTVTDAVSGITSCRIVTAKITYSYLQPS